MLKSLCVLIYLDFIIQRLISDDVFEHYIVPSREFFLALVATILARNSDNSVYCIIAAMFWLDFINQVICEFTEVEYFGIMAAVCVYLSVSKYLNT